MKTLRPYQDAAVKSLFNWLFSDGTGHPLVVAPVAAGKSLIIAEFIRQVHEQYPRTRIVVLTHVKELLIQNAEELMGQYPACDFGFYCASLDQKKLHNDVTFASIQSVVNKIGDFNRCPEIIIVDECHLISHKDSTQYRKFFDAVHAINPNVKIIGLTGTPFRSDSGRLDDGEGKLFDGICYEIEMSYMIEQGYWAKPVTPALATKMDVSGVKTRGGDYVVADLEARINNVDTTNSCLSELLKHGEGRRKWLVFTAAVQHCKDVCAAIQAAGIAADYVTGDTPTAERDAIIARFRRGELRCLVNVAVLTTGFNVPDVDLLCFMRPTKSPVLYIQTTGRGVRPVYADGFDLSTKEGRLAAIAASQKPDCMILDFGGVVDELGPIDRVTIRKKNKIKEEKEGKGPAMKVCPHCATMCMAGQHYCYNCSYCFIELAKKAAENAVVSMDEPPQTLAVIGMSRLKWAGKNGKPDTMMVTYSTYQDAIKEWVCFNHENGSFPHDKAKSWHKKFGFNTPMPANVDEAVKFPYYDKPSFITVRKDGKFWRILDYDFKKQETEIEQVNHGPLDSEIPF